MNSEQIISVVLSPDQKMECGCLTNAKCSISRCNIYKLFKKTMRNIPLNINHDEINILNSKEIDSFILYKKTLKKRISKYNYSDKETILEFVENKKLQDGTWIKIIKIYGEDSIKKMNDINGGLSVEMTINHKKICKIIKNDSEVNKFDASINFDLFLEQMNFIDKGKFTFDDYIKGIRCCKRQKPDSWEKIEHNGYILDVHSNDHEINNKPHFHVIKNSENIDSRFNFDGDFIDDLKTPISSKMIKNIKKYCSIDENKKELDTIWSKHAN